MGSNEVRETVLEKERMDVTLKSGRKVTASPPRSLRELNVLLNANIWICEG